MIHPNTELRFISEEIGIGVVATRLIPKGTIVWISDDLDMVFDEDEVDAMDEGRRNIIYKYGYTDNEDQYILNWDHARYMNHSFHPNCIDTAYDFQLAVKDIQPGEQLTTDYGIMGDDVGFECLPEEGTARTGVKEDDYLHYYREWDEMASDAFRYFLAVDQPLKHFIPEHLVDKVNEIASGTRPMDSILTAFID
jgi:hypothetical protein